MKNTYLTTSLIWISFTLLLDPAQAQTQTPAPLKGQTADKSKSSALHKASDEAVTDEYLEAVKEDIEELENDPNPLAKQSLAADQKVLSICSTNKTSAECIKAANEANLLNQKLSDEENDTNTSGSSSSAGTAKSPTSPVKTTDKKESNSKLSSSPINLPTDKPQNGKPSDALNQADGLDSNLPSISDKKDPNDILNDPDNLAPGSPDSPEDLMGMKGDDNPEY